VIGSTLKRLCPTLVDRQKILVVADNCDDETASLACNYGCEVIERFDPTRRGKGYALQFAIEHLNATHNPSVVIVLDADCRVAPFTISRISALAYEQNRPVQALNLSHAPSGSHTLHFLSMLGFRFKNLIRPRGLNRLGLPCHLMGTGMAIPWTLLRECRVAGDHLAEDMNLGVELALKGYPAVFCPDGRVDSDLPQQESAFLSQRTRWEQGHLRTSLTQIPSLLFQGIRKGDIALVSLALDLMVPPLAFLMLCWFVAVLGTAFGWLLGASSVPLFALLVAGMLTLFVILSGWWTFCRRHVPFYSLMSLPIYVFRKLPIYGSFLLGRSATQWVRTQRDACSTQPASSIRE
jgi:cellulose synthase/poly-beta-1,6-N-acetylglucosamine synthase-like glycosyltransferase